MTYRNDDRFSDFDNHHEEGSSRSTRPAPGKVTLTSRLPGRNAHDLLAQILASTGQDLAPELRAKVEAALGVALGTAQVEDVTSDSRVDELVGAGGDAATPDVGERDESREHDANPLVTGVVAGKAGVASPVRDGGVRDRVRRQAVDASNAGTPVAASSDTRDHDNLEEEMKRPEFWQEALTTFTLASLRDEALQDCPWLDSPELTDLLAADNVVANMVAISNGGIQREITTSTGPIVASLVARISNVRLISERKWNLTAIQGGREQLAREIKCDIEWTLSFVRPTAEVTNQPALPRMHPKTITQVIHHYRDAAPSQPPAQQPPKLPELNVRTDRVWVADGRSPGAGQQPSGENSPSDDFRSIAWILALGGLGFLGLIGFLAWLFARSGGAAAATPAQGPGQQPNPPPGPGTEEPGAGIGLGGLGALLQWLLGRLLEIFGPQVLDRLLRQGTHDDHPTAPTDPENPSVAGPSTGSNPALPGLSGGLSPEFEIKTQAEIEKAQQIEKVRRLEAEAAERLDNAEREGMRWQMNLKNQKLRDKGEAERYPDLDAAVDEGMQKLADAKARGYPYGFADKAKFDAFAAKLHGGVAAKGAPPGGIQIPTDAAAIQGSACYRPQAHDVDVALLAETGEFHQLIEQSFPKEAARVRSRGLDPFTMDMAQTTNAAERTMINAVKTGIIKRNVVKPKLSDLRDELQALTGTDVDLSVVLRGGSFDRLPYFPIPRAP